MKMKRVDGTLGQTPQTVAEALVEALATEQYDRLSRPPTPPQCRRHLCHLLERSQPVSL